MSLGLLEKFARPSPIFYTSIPSISNQKREVTQPQQSEETDEKPVIKDEKPAIKKTIRLY